MYRFILTDLNMVPIGQVQNADERSVTRSVRGLPQAKFRVNVAGLQDELYEPLLAQECYLKVYQDLTLKHFGPIVASEEVGDAQGGSIMATSAGQAWIFTKRIIGQTATGVDYPLQDRALTARQLIDAENARQSMRILTDALSFSGSTATYTAGPYARLSNALRELSDLLDGFDWAVIPQEPDGSGNIGTWTARPLLGVSRPDVVFEYGVGRKNIADYKIQVNREVQANRVINPGQGLQAAVAAEDATARAKWGLMEDVAELGLEDATMRQQLVDEHVSVRANPRRVVTFTPHIGDRARVPAFGLDYDVGDIVTARAARGNRVLFNGQFRVYGATVNIDKAGTERVSLTVSDEGFE